MAAKDLLENVIEQKKSIEDIYSELERVLQSNRKLQNDLVTLGKFFKDEIAQIKKYIVESNNVNNRADDNIISIAESVNNLEAKVNGITEGGVAVNSSGSLDELFLRYVRDELSEREKKIVQSVEEILSKELSKTKSK
ncbi:hypothetical protein GPS25_08620 [Campylobacter fetus]|jgi:hypothetical protein|uniref:Uncharacterized protein n=2 Tax=Campylobacter TaxID=194 RepID=A0A6F9JDE9_CAMFE|nr:hypothetical protein [Campylobacter fetus]